MRGHGLILDLISTGICVVLVFSLAVVSQESGDGDAPEQEAALASSEGGDEQTAEPVVCADAPYEIKNVCDLQPIHKQVFGPQVTLENLKSLIYPSGVVQRLVDKCAPGEWCLSKDSDIRYDSLDFLLFCDLNKCLLNMSEDCINMEREMTISGLRMLCDMKEMANISRNCFISIHKVLQVNMADLKRLQMKGFDHSTVCTQKKDKILCSGPCEPMAWNLHCMDLTCESKLIPAFRQFNDWQWFFDMIDSKTACTLNSTDCKYFQQENSWLGKMIHDHPLLKPLENTGGSAAFGIFMGMLFILGTIGALVWMIVRRFKATETSYRDKMDYMEVNSTRNLPTSDCEEEETSNMLAD